MKIKKISNRIIRSLGIICIFVMLSMIFTNPVLAATKNETVYVNLDHDGSVDEIYVVNQLLDEYVDYGDYLEIKNLSTSSEPRIEGDKITFPDSDIKGGLYYQGTLDIDSDDVQLPMNFAIRYFLDDQEMAASELAGKSGLFRIQIDYQVNEACPLEKRDGLMTQISLSLNMSKASDIKAGDASTFVVGNMMNINLTAMPNENGVVVLEAMVDDFTLEPITISLLKFDIGTDIVDSFNEANEGFDDMLEGSSQLVDGSIELKDGMLTLSEASSELESGMADIVSGGSDFAAAMLEYDGGLSDFISGVQALPSGSSQINDGLEQLAINGQSVASGVSDINDGLALLSASNQDLATLATSLLSHPDPNVVALAQGTLQSIAATDQLSVGLSDANNGIDNYIIGVEQMDNQYSSFDTGISQLAGGADDLLVGYDELSNGFSDYYAGIEAISLGMSELDDGISALPTNVQEMINGQIEFNDGLNEAKEQLSEETKIFKDNDLPAVSFTSAEKNTPSSVQYMLMTPKIDIEEEEKIEQIDEVEENFWTRLVALFSKDEDK